MNNTSVMRTVAKVVLSIFAIALPIYAQQNPEVIARAVPGPNDIARFLAGMPVPPDSPLAPLTRDPAWQEHSAFFENIYARPWHKLADLAGEITAYLLNAFGINTKIYFSSQMKASGKKDELVLNLCRELGATAYLSGPLGRDYLREDLFGNHGIKVRYDDYQHPTYPQLYSGFEPYMSALDLLFNAGPASLEVILKNQDRVTQ